MKTGLIDVGGGFRGIYGSGIMDYFMDNGINFDYTIGVSAGSANIASYLAGQRGRNIPFYTEYGDRKEYISLKNMITKKNYIDLSYVYKTLSNEGGENPLDYYSLKENPAEYYIVATDANTGKSVYFDKQDIKKDNYSVLMASCSIPVACKPCVINGRSYYDGGLSDPVPIRKALEDGCEKIVLILTRPLGSKLSIKRDRFFSKILSRDNKICARQLRAHAKTYSQSVKLAQKYEKEGRVLIIAPDDVCGLSTLIKTKEGLFRLYEKGYRDAEVVKNFLSY